MTDKLTRTIALGLATFGLLFVAESVQASEKIAQQENMVCTTCHDKPGSKLLTDEGKYYELMGSMKGFAEIEASFNRCTSCHVRKPGSGRLTKKGEQFAFFVGDMKGLRAWAVERHPAWPEADQKDDQQDDPQDDKMPRQKPR